MRRRFMPYDYNQIIYLYFEELKPLFVNYLRKNFPLGYDDIMDIYTSVWVDVRSNILSGSVQPGTKWKSYILTMGWNQANKMVTRRRRDVDSLDDETFNREEFEKQYAQEQAAEETIYQDPELLELLASELAYMPDMCNKVLKLFYYEEMSMQQIADALDYSNARTAITTKNRCLEKIRTRIVDTARRLGIIDKK